MAKDNRRFGPADQALVVKALLGGASVAAAAKAAGTCGISVCGQGHDLTLYVLADASAGGLSPNGWALAVAKAAAEWRADRVVAEAKFAGRFPDLEDELAGMISGGRYDGPGASPDRADDEQVAMSPGHGCAVRGTAHLLMVWAMAELMPSGRREPRVRGF